jgi:phage FluMu protein Com
MIDHNIGCSDCGKKLGHVSLENGTAYPGDKFYGMICPDCKKVRRASAQMVENKKPE